MRNRLLFLAFVLPNLAFGQSWTGFDAANPPFPCQDGWMGCIQNDASLRPELQKDSEGMPLTADLRLGWFDLAPTSNFSPFSTLSSYPDGPVPRISEEPVAVVADPAPDDGTASVDDPTADDPTADDPTANDGTAEVAFMDPEAERARMEARQRKLEEADMRRAQQRATEEADRARREEERRKREADDRARAAQRAMAAVNKAESDADRKRLQAEAQDAADAQKRAAAAAREAEQMRQERERQEAAQRKAADAAAEQSRKADAERKRREADERRKAEAERQQADARRKEADANAAKAADAARAAADKAEKARVAEADKAAKAAADRAAAAEDAEERARLEKEQRALAAQQKADAEAAKKKAADAAAKAKADAQKKAAEDEKRRLTERAAAQEADRKRIQEEQAAKLAAEKAAKTGEPADQPSAAAGAAGCADLIQLETKAVLGKLDGATVQCLEDRLTASTRQTEKSKVSRLLMGNAFATNKSEWERLMKRHLEQIDQSDPDLCYKYAIHLVKRGPGSMFQVIKWADVALENRAVWTGSTYQKRVYGLYRVRTVAANKIWGNYEDKHAANPTDDTNEKLKDARNRTKVYAREWYEYAKAADKDTTDALNTCQSAAGTKKYCEAG